MNIVRSVRELQIWRESVTKQSIGFVPTMGALHAGHISLVEKAKSLALLTAVSVFVNPTQFNDASDLLNYPRTEELDVEKLARAGVDLIFLPDSDEIYSDAYNYSVIEKRLSAKLCGAARLGHFTGVLTVVLKLLNLLRANYAFFGEKDFQQLTLVKSMVKAFFIPTEIIACPTVREADGLAMSSRNQRLTPEERELAPLIYQFLRRGLPAVELRNELTRNGFRVDYVEEFEGRRFVAAFLGKVRLIDNVQI